nr:GNAT family N-acetyltransferase [Propylenella binzhouense]
MRRQGRSHGADVVTASIRVADEADLPGVLALYAQPALDNGNVLPLEAAKAVFARFAAYPDYRLFVAVEDGAGGEAIVGTYALLVMDNIGHLGTPSAIIEDVAVAPGRQGEGIGRAMMAHAIEEARARGCYKAVLSSNARREAAHAFYEGIGFTRHGYSFRVELEPTA